MRKADHFRYRHYNKVFIRVKYFLEEKIRIYLIRKRREHRCHTLTIKSRGNTMQKQEAYVAQIDEWEYCYCINCDRIRYRFELEVTELGIRCSKCGSYDLEAPAWVFCPHAMFVAATKCPRAGKGIKEGKYGIECVYRCNYRKR